MPKTSPNRALIVYPTLPKIATLLRKKSLGDDENTQDEPKFSLSNEVENDVLKYYGKTYNWRETGYIFKDGTRLDLSGKNEGARGGSRQVDHRDILPYLKMEILTERLL